MNENNKKPNEAVKDSGSTQEFSTGAHRDCAVGKGRMDLVPLGHASRVMFNDPVLENVDIFMETRDVKYLIEALKCSISTVPVFRYDEIVAEMEKDGIEMRVYDNDTDKAKACYAHMLIEASKIYEAGAIKYGGFVFFINEIIQKWKQVNGVTHVA